LPRTCRNIWPRFTVSVQTEALSTVGAAGFSFDSPTVIKASITVAEIPSNSCRRLRLRD
jgi:hypothetical protein